MVVADELKGGALPEDRLFVVDGAVVKVEEEAGADDVAVGQVGEVAYRDDPAIGGFEQQKGVLRALGLPYGDRLGDRGQAEEG